MLFSGPSVVIYDNRWVKYKYCVLAYFEHPVFRTISPNYKEIKYPVFILNYWIGSSMQNLNFLHSIAFE